MLAPVFNHQSTYHGFSRFGLLLFAIAIDDDRQRNEKERRKKLAQPKKPYQCARAFRP